MEKKKIPVTHLNAVDNIAKGDMVVTELLLLLAGAYNPSRQKHSH